MKLPVSDIITGTFIYLLGEWRYFSLLVAPAVAVLAIISSMAVWVAAHVPRFTPGKTLSPEQLAVAWPHLAVLLVLFTVMAAVYFLFSVAWHRRYLLPAEAATIGDAYRWRGRHFRFLWAMIKVFLIIAPLAGAAVFAVTILSFAFIGIILAPILFIAIYALAARLSLWLPAAAVERVLSLHEVLELSRGNGIRLVVAYLVTTIVAGAVIGALSVGVQQVLQLTGLGGTLTGRFGGFLVDHFLTMATIAVGVSVLSNAYDRLTAGRRAGPGGGLLPPNA